MIREDYINEAIEIIEDERLESSSDLEYIERYFRNDKDPLTEEELIKIEEILIDREVAAEERHKKAEEEEKEFWTWWDSWVKKMNHYWRETRL